MTIQLFSLGSAVVAGIALTIAAFLTVEAAAERALNDRMWPVIFSLAASAYAATVFFQYNLTGLELQMLIERIQYATLANVTYAVIGYARSLRSGDDIRTITVLSVIFGVVTIIVLVAPGIVEPRLVTRAFTLPGAAYTEPVLGTLGMVILVVILGSALVGALSIAFGRLRTGDWSPVVRIGAIVAIGAGFNDALGAMGVAVPMYVLEYGFLAFFGGILADERIRYGATVALIHRQQRDIEDSNQRLEEMVANRTRQLVQVTEELREEIVQHRRVASELSEIAAEREVLLREIHHRSKNSLQLVASLLNLSTTSIDDPVLRGQMVTLVDVHQERIRAVAAVHEQLWTSSNFSRIDLAAYLRSLAADIAARRRPEGRVVDLDLDLDHTPIHIVVDRAVTVGLWANEAIANAFQHATARADGAPTLIRISLRADSGGAILEVSDNGPGMAPDAREGLGFTLLRGLPQQIGGAVEISNGDGLCCSLRFELVRIG